ncbi:nucleoside phosphorylase domain-containing protein [Aspergillus heterothallicus]
MAIIPTVPRHDAYTVGWICALHEELTAAKAMLDERHERLPQPEHDNNSYILGMISGHNVAIACLPAGEYGTNAAASVATQMRSTFPGIRFLLMVGIGGGVPETADIRLGDVVVSTPTGEYGGVVQFDLGKTVGDGRLVHTGMLNRPPQKLLTAVGNLRSERAMGFDRMTRFLGHMVKEFPEMSSFQYPALASDNLFRTDYEHCGGYNPCAECCDQRMLVSRNQRPSTRPQIHYGLIASGNQVMKHAASRARIAEQYKILCFEMEAAGLMNQFPCLVIRGICDYADSHKNKQWQCYAAATAAAYAKELLGMVQTSDATGASLDDKLSVLETASSADDNSLAFQGQPEWEVAPYSPPQSSRRLFFERLSDYDPYRTCQDYLRRRCPDTTKWVLNHAAFKAWLDRKAYPCLWLSGKIGSGKTLVTSTAVRFLESSRPGSDALVAHFFFSHSSRASLSAKSLFESFAKQILEYLTRANKPYPRYVVKRIKSLYKTGSCPATLGEVVDEIFLLCCQAVPDATYVIDGLDECERSEVVLVLGIIRKMIAQSSCRVLVSARDGIDLVQAIPQAITIPIAGQGIDDDIRKFIDWKIAERSCDRTLTEDGALLRDIKIKLVERADHM